VRLIDEEDAALARLLSDTINDDRYLLLARIRFLKGILDKIRPERAPAPPSPPIRQDESSKSMPALAIYRANPISPAVVAFV
jgi:hypothetical protein